MEPLRLVIVSPDSLLREALARAMARESCVDLLAEISFRPSFPEELAALHPGAVLVHAPSLPTLLQACTAACEAVPKAKVVAFAAPEEPESALPLIEAGVVGTIPKRATPPMILDSLAAIRGRGIACPPELVARAFNRLAELRRQMRESECSEVTKLTPRELQVVSLLTRGLSNKEIAGQLYIEPQTVKNHVHNVLHKLKLRNRVEIAQYAMARNMILPGDGVGRGKAH